MNFSKVNPPAVGMRVKSKLPINDRVRVGSAGVVKSETLSGMVVFVEFDAEPTIEYRLQWPLDVEPVLEEAHHEIPPEPLKAGDLVTDGFILGVVEPST